MCEKMGGAWIGTWDSENLPLFQKGAFLVVVRDSGLLMARLVNDGRDMTGHLRQATGQCRQVDEWLPGAHVQASQ